MYHSSMDISFLNIYFLFGNYISYFNDISNLDIFLSQKLMTPGGGLRALISRRPPGYQMGLLYRLATRQLL